MRTPLLTTILACELVNHAGAARVRVEEALRPRDGGEGGRR